MSEPTRAELMRVVALLEERHGVGVRGDDLPGWLEERLKSSVQALLASQRLDAQSLLAKLEAEPDLVIELANALRVGETRFYRDAAQWEALRRSVLPGMLERRGDAQPVMALSAGCSTGEEAWTLAMLLSEGSQRRGRVRVLGVDRSEPALVTARLAVYDAGSQQHLPADLAQRYLMPAVDGSVRVVPELQPLVTFQCRDLAGDMPPGRYAIIVCKNVLIYFGDEAQDALVQALLRALSDDGVLLVARSEIPIVRSLGARAHEIAPGITAFRSH